MDIRSYKDSDFPRLEVLLKEVGLFQEHMDKRDILYDKILGSPGSIVVGEVEGDMVACAYFVHDPWCSSIFHLGVHPDYQGRGLGTEMLKVAEERLKEKGVESVGAYVETEAGKRMAEKNGYGVFGEYVCVEKRL